jgi:hypothetical protein
MSPDQIALAQLEVAKLQAWITALAIFLGPLTGVIFTYWFQSRKDKSAEKHRLFVTLMGERKHLAFSQDMVKALNTIDVVFSNNPVVVDLWHRYYALLSQAPGQERDHTWLELLTAMATDLGYPRLRQTDLDKFYVPQGHADQLEFQRQIQGELLRVLKATQSIAVVPQNDTLS